MRYESEEPAPAPRHRPTMDSTPVELVGEATTITSALPAPPQNGADVNSPPDLSGRPARPSRRGSRRFFRVALLVSVAMIVTGTATATTRYIYDQRPAGVVTRYFEALASGDASGALGFGDLSAGSRELLTPDVLQAQLNNGQISNIAVLSTAVHGSHAEVDVKYSLSGILLRKETIIDRVSLVREDGDWRLASVVVPSDFASSGASDRISIGGHRVPMGRYLLFPGASPIHVDTPTLKLTDASSVVRFTGDSSGFMLEPSTPGVRPMQTALASAFAKCMAGTAPVQAACPVPSGSIRTVPGSFHGTTSDDVLDSTRLRFSVGQSPVSVILATSTVQVSGTVEELDFNNVAAPAQYQGPMTVSAYALATHPSVIYWGTP